MKKSIKRISVGLASVVATTMLVGMIPVSAQVPSLISSGSISQYVNESHHQWTNAQDVINYYNKEKANDPKLK